MTIKKMFKNLYHRYIRSVSCSRCGGFLYRDSERLRGIGAACRRRELEETNNGEPVPAEINEDQGER